MDALSVGNSPSKYYMYEIKTKTIGEVCPVLYVTLFAFRPLYGCLMGDRFSRQTVLQ